MSSLTSVDRTPPELMPDPARLVYVLTGVALAAGALLLAYTNPLGASVEVSIVLSLVALATLSGWLWRRRGYSFVEGWFAGVIFFPLAAAFAIFGPKRGGAEPF